MSNNSNSSNDSICSVFDSYDYVIVAAVSAGSAMVSALCCVFVICLIFLFKKHYFFIQRIILYHCLAALFRSIAVTLRLHRLGYQNHTPSLNALCTISAFVDQVTLWYSLFDVSVISFTLLMTAVFRKNVSRLEGLFIVLIFFVPLTFNWIPFINNSFGRLGPWCWIRIHNYEDCSEHSFGVIVQNVLWNVPAYIFNLVMIPTYFIVIVFVARQRYCRKPKSVYEREEHRALVEHLHEEVWPLLFLPFGIPALNVFYFINSVYTVINITEPSYALWMLQAIFSPLGGGYIALIYVLDRDTLKRLNYRNLKALLTGGGGKVAEYTTEPGRSDSATGELSFASPYSRYVGMLASSVYEQCSISSTYLNAMEDIL